MMRKKIIGYVSEIDQFLDQFDLSHPLSASQEAEIKKYQRIDQLRDHPKAAEAASDIWEGF